LDHANILDAVPRAEYDPVACAKTKARVRFGLGSLNVSPQNAL